MSKSAINSESMMLISSTAPQQERAALVLNGELNIAFLQKQLAKHSAVYCTDGAYNLLRGTNVSLTRVYGDFDSINPAYLDAKCISTPDQSFTDFEKALQFIKRDHQAITVYGANGKALDHNLGNLSVALKHARELDIIFSDEYHDYWFAKSPTLIHQVKDRIISIVPMPMAINIELEGFLYELKGEDLEFGTRVGTRNQAVQDSVSIHWQEGNVLVFVEQEPMSSCS